MVSYNKLWKLLIDKGLNKKELITLSGVSSSSIAKMTKGENVTTDVLCKICEVLVCDFKDIMEYIKKEI
jgi:DNA-binding Xre family transcriptional regulator